ncbi:MAG: outer membrane beta-barrel protein [Thalassotalea sp.]
MNLKKVITISVTTSLLTMLLNSFAHADDDWNNRVSILLGNKDLDTDAFGDKNHSAFGIGMDIKHKDWPVSIAVDLLAAGKETNSDNIKSERVTGGLHLGLRKHWTYHNIEPYIGGGVNFAVAENTKVSGDTVEKQDNGDLGCWLSTGINWKFDNKMIIGAEIRFSDAEVELFDTNIKTGGVYSMLSVGYQF